MKSCKCGNPGNYEMVDGQYQFICESCLEYMGYRYCDECNEWKTNVKQDYVTELMLCGECENYAKENL